MNDQQTPRRGRQKKHPADDLHFKAESEISLQLEELHESDVVTDIPEENFSPAIEPVEPVEPEVQLPIVAPSPVQEKIEELVEAAKVEPEQLNGWFLLKPDDHPSDLPPRNGMPLRLSLDVDSEGTLAFWKKTRAFANSTKKWETTGSWCNFLTGLPVDFTPKYWKSRYGV